MILRQFIHDEIFSHTWGDWRDYVALIESAPVKPNKATCAVNYIHANNYNVLHHYLEPCSTTKLGGPLEAAFVTSNNGRSQLIVEFWGWYGHWYLVVKFKEKYC